MKKDLNLKYNSWDKISISLYKKILEILDEEVSPIEQEISIAALLSDKTEDDIWSLNVADARSMLDQLQFMQTFEFDKKYHAKHITLNGEKYDVCVDMTKFTVAQYVDFQQYWSMKNNIEYMHKILSVFIIPHKHQYNEGYDIVEVQNTILEHCPITIANSMLFFYLMESVKSMRATQICLEFQIKRMMKKKKLSPELKEKMEGLHKMIQSLDGLLL